MIIAVGGGPLSDGPLRALATAGPPSGSDGSARAGETSSTTTVKPAAQTGGQEAGAQTAAPQGGGTQEGGEGAKEQGLSQSTATPTATPTTTTTATTPATTTATTPTTTTATPTTTTSPAPAPPSPAASAAPSAPAGTPAPAPGEAPIVVRQRLQRITGGEKVVPRIATTHGQPATGGAAPAAQGVSGKVAPAPGTTAAGLPSSAFANNSVAPPPQLAAGEAGALAAELASSAASVQALSFYRIPLFLLPIYQSAAVQYGVPWQILAAINEIETDYGSDQSVSTAGAVGWMQFMPQTWSSYGVDAFAAGYADPYNPVDAIFAAARYLRAAGAAQNLKGAILAYNHSEEYADSVLLRAKLISTYPQSVIGTLTDLVDARPPVTGHLISWQERPSATAASAPPPTQPKPSSTPGAEAPPAPTTAAAIATGRSASTPAPLKLVDLLSAPHAAVVAVADGRIVKLGASRKLGRYVILKDLYGDIFTYAHLGSIAHSYRLPSASTAPLKAPAAVGSGTHDPAPQAPASAGRQLPQTLSAKTPPPASEDTLLQPQQSPAGMGKVRLFAHPHNPDAIAAAEGAASRARAAARAEDAAGLQPLRDGSDVAAGTVLGHVSLPANAKDGHMQFAIAPAGDSQTIDPAPILENWVKLQSALHPRGAKSAESLVGATASEAFLFSKSRLQDEILSDPHIAMSACSREVLSSGQIDQRVLALIAYLSRSGLEPTIAALRCSGSRYDLSGYVTAGHLGDALAITDINGTPVAHHQGPGSITDTTIRTLLTLPARFAPHQIVSLMHYPGVGSTLARSDHGAYIEVAFEVAKPALAARAAHSAPSGPSAPSPLSVGGDLSSAQWEALITRVGALPSPALVTSPSSSAIADPRGGRGE